jgi:hypothetical protein
LFLSIWFFSFLPLVCFTYYFRFATWKIQKNISLCSLFPFILVSKIENPKNICFYSLVL